MVKRIIALFMCISMLLSLVTVTYAKSAEDFSIDDKIEILKALDMINEEYDELTIDNSKVLTRAEYVFLAASVLAKGIKSEKLYFHDLPKENWVCSYASVLVEEGLMSVDEDRNFGSDEEMKVEEALEISLRALGYSPVIDTQSIMTLAQNVGICSGLKLSEGMNFNNAVLILYNTLFSKGMGFNGNSYVLSNKTYIENRYSIFFEQGLLESFDGISIATEYGNDMTYISGQAFDAQELNLYDLLGSEIVYLYECNKQGEKKLIWAKKVNDKNEMLTLMYAENKVSFDVKTYELDYYDGKAYRTIKLNKDIDVVYNDEYVMSGIEELLTNEFYSVKLIERKGGYKCLILKGYENYIVGGIDVAGQYIYDKPTGKILDISAFDKVEIKTAEGKSIEFDSIKLDDVLTVFKSKSGDRAEIIVSDGKAEGIVKLVKKDKSGYQYITIDDKAYRFASLDKEEKISVSSEIVLYLDVYGHIAMVRDCENIENLAYLLQSYYDKKEEKLYVRLFDRSGKILVLECAKKLKINEDKTYKDLENADLRLKNCGSGLMLYKKNVDGQIKNIQLATNDQTSKLRLRFPKESLRYRSTGSRLGQKMCLDNNTIIFGVPSDVGSAKDEDFIVTNKAGLYGDENYTTESYAYTEKVGYEQILVIYDNDWNYDQGNKAGVLVTEISKVVNEDGTLVDCIGGWQGAQQIEKICHEDYSAESSGVEIGDYIIFSQNKQGEIVGISVKYDLSTGKRPKGKDMHVIEALSSGYVHEVNGNVVTVGLESGADFDMAYDFASGAVLIYYEDGNYVETGTVNDLIPYETAGEKCDFLLTHMRYSKQLVYVVYR